MSSNVVFDQPTNRQSPADNGRGPNILRYVIAFALAAAIITGCSLAFWGTATVTGWFSGITVGEENYSYYDKLNYGTFPVITAADKNECFRRAWVARPTKDASGNPAGVVCFRTEGY